MPSEAAVRARKRASPHRSGRRKNRRAFAATDPARISSELNALQSFRTIFGSSRTHDSGVRSVSGISGSQLWALAEIAGGDGMSVNGLAERMALHQTTASNLVNFLAESKLVRRARDATDRRVIHLHATAEGKKALLRVPGPHAGLLVDALRRLELDELGRLRQSLALLVGLMQQTAAAAAGIPLMGE